MPGRSTATMCTCCCRLLSVSRAVQHPERKKLAQAAERVRHSAKTLLVNTCGRGDIGSRAAATSLMRSDGVHQNPVPPEPDELQGDLSPSHGGPIELKGITRKRPPLRGGVFRAEPPPPVVSWSDAVSCGSWGNPILANGTAINVAVVTLCPAYPLSAKTRWMNGKMRREARRSGPPPSRSWMLAGCGSSTSPRPSVSTSAWRLRPLVFFPAS
jgi:hypothetical protein